MRKVLLINTPDDKKPINRDMAGGLGFDRGRTTILPPLDLLSYATFLEQKGYPVVLFDAQVESSASEQIKQLVTLFKPEVVILTISLPSLDHDIVFANWLQEILPSNCYIVFKTSIRHPPIVEKILRESDCAYCIIGECDLIIDQILMLHTSQGTARIVGGKYKEEQESLLYDLDLLPDLNRKFLKNEKYCYSTLGAKTTTMQTSRGCPFRCSYYCPYPLVQGSVWRFMSAPRIIREIQTIVQEEKITNIFFRDATFTLNKKRIQELCELIIERSLKFSWWCETRVDCLDVDLVNIMREAGCVGMNIGVETGDENLRTVRAKQGVTLSEIARLTHHCRRIGVRLRFLLMIGLPGETKQTLYETFKLVAQSQPDYIGLTTATPYPGTPFYTEALEKNWIKNPNISTFGGHGYNTQIDPLSPEDLKFAMEKIHAVYRFSQETDASVETCKGALQNEFLNWIKQ